MSKGDKRSKKREYCERLQAYLEEFKTIFIVNVDNVSSNQMHQIRHSLRADGNVLMGKNTMVRRVLKALIVDNPKYETLLSHVKGNIGFVFTNGDLKEVREKITSNRVAAPARAGAIAPVDVYVPGGNTGMDPSKTSFFQALGIPTKITRGTIEIINDVHLLQVGSKVGQSEATLLNMLKISPFTYGMTVVQIYDEGNVFPPSILDIDNETLVKHFLDGIQSIAALSLQINYPTMAAVPHMVINNYKDILAISIATDYTYEGSEKVKAYLADPTAFAVAAPVAVETSTSGAAEESKPAEEEEESDDDMGFGLFD
jgi:large subunit ribosomal protein LP0